ncbi:hypothetical protein LX36DRAFT_387215, partial [Colletotrichum falcatum]
MDDANVILRYSSPCECWGVELVGLSEHGQHFGRRGLEHSLWAWDLFIATSRALEALMFRCSLLGPFSFLLLLSFPLLLPFRSLFFSSVMSETMVGFAKKG